MTCELVLTVIRDDRLREIHWKLFDVRLPHRLAHIGFSCSGTNGELKEKRKKGRRNEEQERDLLSRIRDVKQKVTSVPRLRRFI